jgi:MSHA biogenesis protein MshK
VSRNMIKGGLAALLASLLWSGAQAADLRDPTRPGRGGQFSQGQGDSKAGALVLGSIIHRDGQSHAVINNQIVSIGERVQGVKLIRIGDDKVILADGRTLTLFQAIATGRQGEAASGDGLPAPEVYPDADIQRQGK